ncbi:MAG: DUF1801 domain-containing protein [Coriobacteriia bacterium]|nr:DUF1801 domain-containing protein [Coriobacteriia bacterium]
MRTHKRKAEIRVADDKNTTKPARAAGKKKVDGLTEVLETIAAMPDQDRAIATRFHTIVEKAAPSLKPRLWYGMPAYSKDGKVLCFFQAASKFKTRYSTFGFEESASLDEGAMWPTAYALVELGDAEEARVEELIRRAMG